MLSSIHEKLSTVLEYDKDMLSIQEHIKQKRMYQFLLYHGKKDPRQANRSYCFTSEKLLSMDALELLDIIYSAFHEMFRLKGAYRISDECQFLTLQIDGYWLHTLYHVTEVISNEENSNKIIDITDKRDGKTQRLYLFFSPEVAGWYPTSKESTVMLPLLQALNPITSIKLRHDTSIRKRTFDLVEGILNLPKAYSDDYTMVICQVLLHEKDRVEYYYIEMRTTLRLIKLHAQKVVACIEDSRMKHYVLDDSPLWWFDKIKDKHDTIKNPRNSFIHDLLPVSDVPIYEGKNLYITSQRDFYVMMSGTWVLVEKDWFFNYHSEIPDIAEDLLVLQLSNIAIE